MSGVLRLGNTGAGTGRSTLEASAGNDQTFTLPSNGGTLLTSNYSDPGGTITLNGADIVITNANVNINGGALVIDETTGDISVGGDITGNLNITGDVSFANGTTQIRASDGRISVGDYNNEDSTAIYTGNISLVRTTGTDVCVGIFDEINQSSPVTRLLANGSAIFGGDVQMESQNSGPLAGFRNLIINGDFRIFQRGTAQQGSGTGGNRIYAGPDHFFKFNNADTVGQIDTSSDNFGGVTGRFHYACRIGGGQNSRIFGQCIEGPLPKGMDVTYSAWVRFSQRPDQCYLTTHSTPLVALNDFSGFYGGTGTNQVYVNPDGWDGIYPGDNIWFKIQRTFTPASPELGLGVGFQPIFSGNTTANVDITGIQVEFGSEATPFEYRPIGTELALCQRYFYRIEGYTGGCRFGIGEWTSNALRINANALVPVTMRDVPSIASGGNIEIMQGNTGTTITSMNAFGSQTAWVLNMSATGFTGATGDIFGVRANGSDRFINFSAEL